jgi:hypothetical protein
MTSIPAWRRALAPVTPGRRNPTYETGRISDIAHPLPAIKRAAASP